MLYDVCVNKLPIFYPLKNIHTHSSLNNLILLLHSWANLYCMNKEYYETLKFMKYEQKSDSELF